MLLLLLVLWLPVALVGALGFSRVCAWSGTSCEEPVGIAQRAQVELPAPRAAPALDRGLAHR